MIVILLVHLGFEKEGVIRANMGALGERWVYWTVRINWPPFLIVLLNDRRTYFCHVYTIEMSSFFSKKWSENDLFKLYPKFCVFMLFDPIMRFQNHYILGKLETSDTINWTYMTNILNFTEGNSDSMSNIPIFGVQFSLI